MCCAVCCGAFLRLWGDPVVVFTPFSHRGEPAPASPDRGPPSLEPEAFSMLARSMWVDRTDRTVAKRRETRPLAAGLFEHMVWVVNTPTTPTPTIRGEGPCRKRTHLGQPWGHGLRISWFDACGAASTARPLLLERNRRLNTRKQ